MLVNQVTTTAVGINILDYVSSKINATSCLSLNAKFGDCNLVFFIVQDFVHLFENVLGIKLRILVGRNNIPIS